MPERFDLGDHSCSFCGAAHAPFGYDGDLKEGRPPLWGCGAHRAEVAEMGIVRATARAQAARIVPLPVAAKAARTTKPAAKKAPDARQAGFL